MGDIKEMLAAYGYAAYQSQSCERKLMVLGSALNSLGEPMNALHVFDESMDELDKKTLGRILNVVRGLTVLPAGFDERLSSALEKRNHLIHRFFWEHADHELSAKGRDAMTEELHELARFFSGTALQIAAVSTALGKAVYDAGGLPPEAFEALIMNEMDKAHKEAQERDEEGGDV